MVHSPEHLRPRLLKHGPASLATNLDSRTLRRLYAGDPEALATFKQSQPANRKKATRALQAAERDVLQNNLPTTQAARKHNVNLGSLRVRITKAKKMAANNRSPSG